MSLIQVRQCLKGQPEYAPQRDSKTMDIGCKAHCIFNKEGECIANGITVNAIAEKPYCMTFVNRS